MAEQSFIIEAARINSDTATQKRWNWAADEATLVVDPAIAGSTVARLFRRFIARTNANGFEFRMVLAPTGTTPQSQQGDDLSPVWETYVEALGVAQDANIVAAIPGPDHPDNFLRDTTETYLWTIPAGPLATACENFFFTDLDTSAAFTLTLRTPGVDAGDVSWAFVVSEPTVTKRSAYAVDAGDVSWAFVISEPTVTKRFAYAVDAGDASWAFVISEPTVTKRFAYAVDAGDASWAFVISEPTVTKRSAYAVDAGDASWAFVISEPTVTKNRSHLVNAGDVSWTFAVLQPTVTKGTDYIADAGDASWAFVVSEPTVTKSTTYAVDAGDASWAFVVSEPTVTKNRSHLVNAGDVSWTFAVLQPTVQVLRGPPAPSNPIFAIVELLLADQPVAFLVDDRVYGEEIPERDNQHMPRPAVVVNHAGGGSLGPGARSRAPWVVTRLDIQSYGKTPEEASILHWWVYRRLTTMGREVWANTLLQDAVVSGGPIPSRDSNTDWPFMLGVYDLSSCYNI